MLEVTKRNARPACYKEAAFLLLTASGEQACAKDVRSASGSALQAAKEASRQARDGTALEAYRQPAALGAISELDEEDH